MTTDTTLYRVMGREGGKPENTGKKGTFFKRQDEELNSKRQTYGEKAVYKCNFPVVLWR